MKTLPWFRMYHEALDDEKLRLLAFEDRWHFVAILCLKCKGVLDTESDAEMLQRKVAVKMGLTCAELENVMKRLSRMSLVNAETYQPVAWDERQMQSDGSTERVQAYRERMKQAKRFSNVTVTAQDTDEDTDKEKEVDKKNTRAIAPPDGVSESVWHDFKKLRTSKKAPITKTAIAGIEREAATACISLESALSMCCERGWTGFKADWVKGGTSSSFNKQESLEARNRAVGQRWADGEVMPGAI